MCAAYKFLIKWTLELSLCGLWVWRKLLFGSIFGFADVFIIDVGRLTLVSCTCKLVACLHVYYILVFEKSNARTLVFSGVFT